MRRYFFPHDDKPEHVKSLDGLRGFAVISVLFSHASLFHLDLHSSMSLYGLGKTGVYIFFILSAYLLDKQIISILTDNKSTLRYWMNYLLRRFLRIFPLFMISLFFYYFLNQGEVETFITSPKDIMDHLLFEQAAYMYWSVPAEFKYYFLSPIFMIIFHKIFKWRLKWISIGIVSLILGSIVIDEIFNLDNSSTVRNLPIFLIGTSVAIIEKFRRDLINRNFLYLGFLGLSAMVLNVVIFRNDLMSIYSGSGGLLPEALLALTMGFIFLTVRYNQGTFKSISENSYLRFFGAISYSLYLLHWGVLLIINEYNFQWDLLNIFLFYAISVVLASISYLCIEYPFSQIRLRRSSLIEQKVTFKSIRIPTKSNVR